MQKYKTCQKLYLEKISFDKEVMNNNYKSDNKLTAIRDISD